jgi:hypothetical protein
MHMKRRGLVLVTVALVGCGQTPAVDAPRAWPGADVPSADGYDFETLVSWSAEIDEHLEAHADECMDDAGFPQLTQARALTLVRSARGERQTLAFDPLEAGPYTDEQAREYGMIGTVYAFNGGEPGYVVSRSDAYDSQLSRCRASFAAGNGAAVEALLARFTDLRNSMRRSLLQATERSIEELLSARLACVRESGYPDLALQKQMTMKDLLSSAGVTPGTASAQSAEEEPDPGGVRVYPPRVPVRYVPSGEETAFALTYVACGRRTGFESSWGAVQQAARATILATWEHELSDVGADMAAVRTALASKS